MVTVRSLTTIYVTEIRRPENGLHQGLGIATAVEAYPHFLCILKLFVDNHKCLEEGWRVSEENGRDFGEESADPRCLLFIGFFGMKESSTPPPSVSGTGTKNATNLEAVGLTIPSYNIRAIMPSSGGI